MPRVITANKLRTGAVVYMMQDGRWTDVLQNAAVADGADALKAHEGMARAAVESNQVTAVYAFDVSFVDGKPVPSSVRERIRAAHAVIA
jgi:hypothetical protein